MSPDFKAFEEEPTENLLWQESADAKADELLSGSIVSSETWQIDCTRLDLHLVSEDRSRLSTGVGCLDRFLQQIVQRVQRVFSRLVQRHFRKTDRIYRPRLTVVTDPFTRRIVATYLSWSDEN